MSQPCPLHQTHLVQGGPRVALPSLICCGDYFEAEASRFPRTSALSFRR